MIKEKGHLGVRERERERERDEWGAGAGENAIFPHKNVELEGIEKPPQKKIGSKFNNQDKYKQQK